MLRKLITLVFALLFTTVGFASVVFPWASDDDFNGLRKGGIERFIDLVYFTIVSFSTAGYGDISPKSTRAKLLVSTFLLFVNITAIYGIYNALIVTNIPPSIL
jgi:uncharacterized protein YacL